MSALGPGVDCFTKPTNHPTAGTEQAAPALDTHLLQLPEAESIRGHQHGTQGEGEDDELGHGERGGSSFAKGGKGECGRMRAGGGWWWLRMTTRAGEHGVSFAGEAPNPSFGSFSEPRQGSWSAAG